MSHILLGMVFKLNAVSHFLAAAISSSPVDDAFEVASRYTAYTGKQCSFIVRMLDGLQMMIIGSAPVAKNELTHSHRAAFLATV